ncbi:hypothetical protein Tco_1431132 [Tanacetum coccineum]
MANLPPPNHVANLLEDEPVHPEPAHIVPEPELPFPVGCPFFIVVDSVVVHHEEIGGLGARTENLEHALGKLSMKTREVSDAQVEDSIAIGEIRHKVTTLEGHVEVLATQHDLMISKGTRIESTSADPRDCTAGDYVGEPVAADSFG